MLRDKIMRVISEENFGGEHMFQDLVAYYRQQCEQFISELRERPDDADTKNSYERCSAMLVDLEDLQAIVFHKNVAKCQRQAYTEHQTPEFLKDKILIDLDYQEKIKIGLSPRQPSEEFYNQVQRSCLGKS